jgi:hypothetical protein
MHSSAIDFVVSFFIKSLKNFNTLDTSRNRVNMLIITIPRPCHKLSSAAVCQALGTTLEIK